MKTVLVTGGAGFIGSHTVDLLVKKRYRVIVFDNLSTGKLSNLNPKANFVQGDIRDLALLDSSMKSVCYVIHLAAQVSVLRSVENPKETFEINESGTKNVLVACKKHKVGKIVFSSSCAVYGDNPNLPLRENSALRPMSPYAESKISAESLLQASGLPFVAFRYFNIYGERQAADSQYAAAIPIFARQAVANKPLTIFGDGSQTRDFVSVHDAACANVLALSRGKGVYNLCTGIPVSVNALSGLILRLAKSRSRIIHADERPGDIRHSFGSFSRVRKDLRLKPRVVIEKGLKDYLKWLAK
jgi:UDP-glucose 4-epimerase